jgi:serine/threonine-protein phosphatase 5
VAKKQLEATQKLQRRIEFEKAIEMDEEESSVEHVLETIRHGGAEVEASYSGPHLPPASEEQAAKGKKYGISADFIKKMEEWFKAGKFLAKRYVWEIVLGCWEACVQEESLNEVVLEEGMTCDVIGDTHGAPLPPEYLQARFKCFHLRTILRPPPSILINRPPIREALFAIQR